MARAELPGGVSIDPVAPATNDNCHLTYNGLLAKSGADKVYAHVGYGNPQKWFGIKEYEMKKHGESFVTEFRIEATDTLHICFRDSINNWDNNSGKNWSTPVDSDYQSYA
ncbi:MAG: carbohydrate-binding protein [Candidatus Saccharibacteria bacterium]